MTRVCLVGSDGVDLRAELLSRETSRRALSTYQLRALYANTLVVDTISLGAAVSLLNDLNWYLVRFADEALVLEPSVSDAEWLSRRLATAIRDGDVTPDGSSEFLKIYGVESSDDVGGARLVEPMYATRRDGELPDYDLRPVDETFVVRVTEDEYAG